MDSHQLEHLVKGAWAEIVKLWDRVHDLEEKVEDSEPPKPKIDFHPKD